MIYCTFVIIFSIDAHTVPLLPDILPVEHVLHPISQLMHSPVSGSCICPEKHSQYQKPLRSYTAYTLHIYPCHRMLVDRCHSVACTGPDIWRICCHLCRVHSWRCRAGRHSEPCQDRVHAGSASDSEIGWGNAPVHFHLRKKEMISPFSLTKNKYNSVEKKRPLRDLLCILKQTQMSPNVTCSKERRTVQLHPDWQWSKLCKQGQIGGRWASTATGLQSDD